MAVGLAGVLALTSFASSCKSGEASDATTAAVPEAVETKAVADVVDDGSQDRVARVAAVEGNLALRPIDAEEWKTAEVNSPVLEGYDVYVDDDSRAELMLGDSKYVRVGDGAEFTVSRLDPNWAQLELTSGACTLALDEYTDDDYYEISTPGGALVPSQAGSYRVDVLPDGRSRVTVIRGVAQITTPDGTFEASEGDVIDLGYEPAQVNVVSGAAPQYRDDFDDWSYQRDAYYTDLYSHDVPEPVRAFDGRNDIYGVLGLAAYGVWQALDDDDDHYVWIPHDARRSDWSPYSSGYWDYGPTVGWTWISNEPWGWAPYHYGRWDYRDNVGWCWAPYYDNQVVGVSSWRQRYRWYPSQVYFYQPPERNYYAWVPLAPGEAYIPYTTNLVVRRDVTVVDYRPRFFRERRGLYVVTADQLERRERPRRADRVVIADIDRFGNDNIRIAKLPKPNRIVGANEVARIRPRDAARRPVVVTEKSIDRPVKPATQRALARDQRQVRRAQTKPLKVDRQPINAANAPQRLERKPGRNRVAPDAPRAQVQPGAQPAVVDRQQRRAERQAERQQQQQAPAARQPRAVQPQQQPRAVNPERQQRREMRQQQRQQQPRQQAAPQRVPRAERAPAVRQPRAPKAERPQARQQQVQRAPRVERSAPAVRQARQAAQPRMAKPNAAPKQGRVGGGGGGRNRP